MAEETKSTGATGTQAQPGPQQPQAGFPTDYSNLSTVYTNFCRVNVTPEELVLDFGLNTQLAPNPTEPVHLTHRVVMNFYTAKRLLNALAAVVTQHEGTYGTLELDFQRRAGAARRGGPSMGGPPSSTGS